ncbi:MAG TPA: hypothetical protein V6D11_01765 [Waterburya sp.]
MDETVAVSLGGLTPHTEKLPDGRSRANSFSQGMIIVSNTSPINYLILIGHINLLPELFQQIIIPQAVYSELSDTSVPSPVQTWIATPPDWLKIQPVSQPSDAILDLLDPGEREAILLAQELNADLLLLDDMKARRTATERGLAIRFAAALALSRASSEF